MLEFPIEFESTIPKRLGLPPLPSGSNKAEGVVPFPSASFLLDKYLRKRTHEIGDKAVKGNLCTKQ